MAKQSSHLTLQGTIGGLTYVKTHDGFYIRKKTTIPKERYAKDPAFEQLRENNAEFARAVNAAKLLRDSLSTYSLYAKDRTSGRRFTSLLMEVVKADPVNGSGQRKVQGPQTVLLKDFNFNAQAPFNLVFKRTCATSIDRLTGKIDVSVPAFAPGSTISKPEAATHFKLFIAGVDADFENGKAETATAETGLIVINSQTINPVQLSVSVNANSANPLFLFLGIQFYKSVNGIANQIKTESHNALVVAEVSGS